MTFDSYFAELRGRQRREQLLAEAAHERLLLLARSVSPPGRRRLGPLGAALARPAMALMARGDAALRGAIGVVGAGMVAAGTRLQRLALGPVEACDLEPAAW